MTEELNGGCLDEREAFEAYIVAEGYDGKHWLQRWPVGGEAQKNRYAKDWVQTAWEAWQKRASLSTSKQAGAEPVAYSNSTPRLHIGDSAFEDWYQNYLPNSVGHKQIARDAYAAGMGDPLVTAAPGAAIAAREQEAPSDDEQLVATLIHCSREVSPTAMTGYDLASVLSRAAERIQSIVTPPAATPAAPGDVQILEALADWYHDKRRGSIPDKEVVAKLRQLFLSNPAPVAAPAPAASESAKRKAASLAEAVTKSILFEDRGSTEGWEENLNLGEAAIRVCDARNPPRCSYCLSSTSTPAPAPASEAVASNGDYLRWAKRAGALVNEHEDARIVFSGRDQWAKFCDLLRTPTPGDSADAPVQQAGAVSDAAHDVLAERQRQISAEGWTPEHDDEHDDGRMAVAAAYYATYDHQGKCKGWGRILWPWDEEWCKPKDDRSNLVRAGALVIAEIERIDRAALKGEQPVEPSGTERGEV
jgi:hypothetical protein